MTLMLFAYSVTEKQTRLSMVYHTLWYFITLYWQNDEHENCVNIGMKKTDF